MKLHLIHETEQARLYRDEQKRQQWVPRSVCPHTTKHPSQDGQPPVHEVTIEAWWLRENSFAKLKPIQEQELL